MRHSHLSHAHFLWSQWLQEGDWAIDATCGNGHDTCVLSKLVGESGGVIALDIQEEAIKGAKMRAKAPHIHFFCQSHTDFPPLSDEYPIRLIVYNLGYLPGGDKLRTTLKSSTLTSLKRGLSLIEAGGFISITCYPGHKQGAIERSALLRFSKALDPHCFSVSHTCWENRDTAPSLLIIQKIPSLG